MAYTLNRRLAQLVDSNGQLNTGKIPNDYITSDHVADNTITSAMLHTGFTVSASNLGTTLTPTFGNITTTGYIAGPATFTIDPAAVGDNTGTVVIAGNLQVDGTTTTINSTTMEVDDLNITLASGAANAAAADGAGITVDGASATLLYQSTPDAWSFNKNVGIGTDSPGTILQIGDGTTSEYITIDKSTTGESGILFKNAGNNKGKILLDSNENLQFYVNNTTNAMTILESGNVGIAGTPPSDTNTGYPLLSIGETTAIQGLNDSNESFFGNNAIWKSDNSWEYVKNVRAAQMAFADGTTIFRQAASGTAGNDITWSESMRIDTSGNVLIGTTSTTVGALTSAGVGFRVDAANGILQTASNSNITAIFNRTNTDGQLISFRNAGIEDGQINTLSGRMAIGSSDTGIFFDSTRNCISPFDMSTNDGRNAAIDIGRTGVRFNNAFLEKVTIEGTSNDEGIYFSSNHRIYGGGYRAFEASTTASGTVSLGEGFTSGKVLISAPRFDYPAEQRAKDDNGILRYTKAVTVGESVTTVLTITKTSYSYFIGGTLTLILQDSGSPWGVYYLKRTIVGRKSTHQAGNDMGYSLANSESHSQMDYTPTFSDSDSRTSGQSGGTISIKVANGSGNGSSSCKVIFDGYFAGGTLS